MAQRSTGGAGCYDPRLSAGIISPSRRSGDRQLPQLRGTLAMPRRRWNRSAAVSPRSPSSIRSPMAPPPRRWRGAFPWAVILERRTNDGFADGHQCRRRVGARAVPPAAESRLRGRDGLRRATGRFRRSARPDAAIVGPRILNADGTIQGSARRFPGWSTVHRRPELLADEEVSQKSAVALEPAGPRRGRRDVACRLGFGRVHARAPRRVRPGRWHGRALLPLLGRRRPVQAARRARVAHDLFSGRGSRARRRPQQRARLS